MYSRFACIFSVDPLEPLSLVFPEDEQGLRWWGTVPIGPSELQAHELPSRDAHRRGQLDGGGAE